MSNCNCNQFKQTNQPTQKATFHETYIREIRIQYHATDRAIFATHSLQNARDFIASVLPGNSREHCVALYLSAAH